MCSPRLIYRVAGLIVLSAVLLGYLVNTRWFLLAGFVGVNLLQTSFTGCCPLERVLGRFRVADCIPSGERR